MFAEECETLAVTTQNDFVPFVEETLDERDTTAGVAKSPVQWRNKEFQSKLKIKN